MVYSNIFGIYMEDVKNEEIVTENVFEITADLDIYCTSRNNLLINRMGSI